MPLGVEAERFESLIEHKKISKANNMSASLIAYYYTIAIG